MIVEITLKDRFGEKPIRLDADQVLIRQDNGTPIAVAATLGDSRTQVLTVFGMKDFRRRLAELGVDYDVKATVLPRTRSN